MFGKKKPTVDYNGPRAVIERDMGKYEINTIMHEASMDEVAHLITVKNKVVQLLANENLTYREAMQIPALLKTDLSLSFQEDMLKTLVHPLSGGAEQGDERNHNGDNG